MECRKIFVEVEALFDIEGKMIPLKLRWKDGRCYEVEKVLDIRRAASLKAGGQGMRYTCRMKGKERFLFFDETRWFVEGYKNC
ncbi:MAG: hypothetical protein KHZ62_09770 [Clostridiales bacterium]|nr:hypothetical protein [Clostridiales bacterium]